MSQVRGVKLSVRVLGQAIMGGAFWETFSADKLDEMSFQAIQAQIVQTPIISPPDTESRVLLTHAQLRAIDSLADYSADARATCPKTFDLFS